MTNRFMRGAFPSPRHRLAAAVPHRAVLTTPLPLNFLMWPEKMDTWGNLDLGDCVTAEEAFAKATAGPRLFFSDRIVIRWARHHGFVNGAMLTDVLDAMERQGFIEGGKDYGDGGHNSVDWTDVQALQEAIFTSGPVKLGVAAGDLESYIPGDPPPSGWCITGYPGGLEADHCTSLCGFAPTLEAMAAEFGQHNVPLTQPMAPVPQGPWWAMFTWGSIGAVDDASLRAMTSEAWVRQQVVLPSK